MWPQMSGCSPHPENINRADRNKGGNLASRGNFQSLKEFLEFSFHQASLLNNAANQASLQITAVHWNARRYFLHRVPQVEMTPFLAVFNETRPYCRRALRGFAFIGDGGFAVRQNPLLLICAGLEPILTLFLS